MDNDRDEIHRNKTSSGDNYIKVNSASADAELNMGKLGETKSFKGINIYIYLLQLLVIVIFHSFNIIKVAHTKI